MPTKPLATSSDALVAREPPPPSRDEGGHAIYTVEEGVEALGMGRFQYLVLAMAGLCWTADAMEMLLISFIKAPVQCAFNLTDFEAALVTTSVGVGMLIGCLVWGMIADARGRRFAFILASAMTLLFGVLSAVAPSYWSLMLARGLVGFGIGGVPIAFSLIMEFLPAKSRGIWGMGLAAFWSMGAIFEACVAMLVMPTLGWRYLIAISSLPLFVLLILSPILVPESPRWLASRGRLDEATTILHRAARINGSQLPPGRLVNEELTPNEEEPEPLPNAAPSSRKRFPHLRALVKPGVRKISAQLWLMWFVSAFVYYGAVFLQPDMLAAENLGKHCSYARTLCNGQATSPTCSNVKICKWDAGNGKCYPSGILRQRLSANHTGAAVSAALPNPACAAGLTKSDYVSALWATAGELPGTISTLVLVDVVGRRPLLGYLFGICAFSFFVLLPCPGRWVETCAFFVARAASNGFFQAVYLFTNEIYPSSVRATGMGTSSAVARLGLISTPFVAQFLDNVNFALAIGIYAVSCMLAVITAGLTPIETTRRPLLATTEELVTLLRDKTPHPDDDQFYPFSSDPNVHSVVRALRWPAKIDGRGKRFTLS